VSGAKISPKGRRLEIIPGCIVCKTCEFMAPNIFRVAEKTLSAEVLMEEPTQEDMPGVIDAIKHCPEKVIKFRFRS
jgi:ferredoxin